MSLTSASTRLRSRSRDSLLAQLAAAQPLGGNNPARSSFGSFLDPTLAQSATLARGQRASSAQGREAQAAADVVRRLGRIETSQTQYPGRVPGGTGATGNVDLYDHMRMLQEQQEQADLESASRGGAAPTTRVDLGSLAQNLGRQGSGSGNGNGGPVISGGERNNLLNQMLADTETGGAADFRIRQNARRAEAGTQVAESQATQAKLANDPLAQAKQQASVEQFGQRTTVKPARDEFPVPDETGGLAPTGRVSRYTPGSSTVLKGQADLFKDPNFRDVVGGQRQMLEAGMGENARSMGPALINQQTSRMRNETNQAIAEANNAGRVALEQAKQQGLDSRQQLTLGLQAKLGALRAQLGAVDSSIEAFRYGRGGMPGSGVNADIMAQQNALTEAIAEVESQLFQGASGGLSLGAGQAGTGAVSGDDPQQMLGGQSDGVYEMGGQRYYVRRGVVTPAP